MIDQDFEMLPVPMNGWVIDMVVCDEAGTIITFTNGYVMTIDGSWNVI